MTQQKFELTAEYSPTGDQPQAIEKLKLGLEDGMEHQVLLGVTGSGKTFSMANVIEKVQKPTLIISHNKTLAAQLYQEFREFFPKNSVNYFVSYYDYYQPEAYVPQRDLYIEKEAEINKEIEKLRHSTTQALMTRKDVIVVASVSCIYGLGRPQDYAQGSFTFSSVESPAVGKTRRVKTDKPDGLRNTAAANSNEKERRLKPATTRGEKGKTTREEALQGLVRLLYKRNDWDFKRGCFRVRGDTLEVYPPYGERVLRLEFLGEKLSTIKWVEPETRRTLETLEEANLYPAEHFITPEKRRERAIELIENELENHLQKLKSQGKDLEAHRLKQRTEYDLELIEEMGFCPGIENYSRYLSGREEGEAPYTLLDYFGRNPVASKDGKAADSSKLSFKKPSQSLAFSSAALKDWLCIIDESHMTIPQIRGMYRGDQARKETLVDYGFRLPSAKDNRPLRFSEFQERVPQTIYTSATPSQWEIERAQESAKLQKGKNKSKKIASFSSRQKETEQISADKKGKERGLKSATSKPHTGVVEQLIRPTGLLDPEIEMRPTENQVENLIGEIKKRKEKGERVLVTTLTKRMAEELADYLSDPDKVGKNIRTHYLHSEIETLERSDILADLRRGKYDVVVGINLLREGLDLPEVSLVAILDADKEGFLRSDTSLIQTMGRAARHEEGKAILYADKITGSMQRAIDEIERRREVQKEYNEEHDITPETIKKPIRDRVIAKIKEDSAKEETPMWREMPPHELEDKIWEWEREMREAAEELDFERAAELRDKIRSAQSTL